MAISNFKTTSKPISLIPKLALVTTLLMLLNNKVNSETFSFTFHEFGADQKDLILQGNATTGSSGNVLQLTTDTVGQSVGRALFYAPVLLWESPEVLASFETNFTFVISAPDDKPGDGIAFFIASPDTTIPSNSYGKYLGLFNTSAPNPKDKVVAVEFDTYINPDVRDPKFIHVGIDDNSIESKVTKEWEWQNGKVATAHITYSAASKTLTVIATYHGSSTPVTPVVLPYEIELHNALPQWVRVGFSASTGENKQKTTLLSWTFTSTLEKVQNHEDILITTVV